MYVLLFGKSKAEDVEYFLNKISQEDESSDQIINSETCRKIQRSCEADVINYKTLIDCNYFGKGSFSIWLRASFGGKSALHFIGKNQHLSGTSIFIFSLNFVNSFSKIK